MQDRQCVASGPQHPSDEHSSLQVPEYKIIHNIPTKPQCFNHSTLEKYVSIKIHLFENGLIILKIRSSSVKAQSIKNANIVKHCNFKIITTDIDWTYGQDQFTNR